MYSSAQRINIPAEKRGLSMVFQSYAIWPHMTVFENVAYGLRVRRESKEAIAEKVERALDMVQMRAFAQRGASQLSGGQQQRVALARAFVFQPSVLLFDEPLSNLDAKLRADMRIELRELQHRLGITSVYVTHDLEEALAMSDRIVVMRDGLIEQVGTPGRHLQSPAQRVRGRFRRLGQSDPRRATAPISRWTMSVALETPAGHIVYGMAHGRPGGAELTFSIRTVHLQLSAQKPARRSNVWPVAVERSVFQGDFTQTHRDWGGQRLVIRGAAMEPLAEGSEAFWRSSRNAWCCWRRARNQAGHGLRSTLSP